MRAQASGMSSSHASNGENHAVIHPMRELLPSAFATYSLEETCRMQSSDA